jgi:hypothetical protein
MQQVGDSWRGLEHAETRYAQALRDAFLRLERLDKLAKKFFTKAERRDEWLHDTSELLGATGFGDTLAEVQASRQREGALVTEVTAYTERLELLYSIAATLVSEDYARKDEVRHFRVILGTPLGEWVPLRTICVASFSHYVHYRSGTNLARSHPVEVANNACAARSKGKAIE